MTVALLVYFLCYAGIVVSAYSRFGDVLHPAFLGPTVYFYWTAGNALLYVLGLDIYFGIRVDYIVSALYIFTVALIAFAVPLLVRRPRVPGMRRVLEFPSSRRDALVWTLGIVASASNVAVYGLLVGRLNYGAAKLGLLPDLVFAQSLHANYLLAWLILLSAMFACFGCRLWRVSTLLSLNIILYFVYSLLTYERDFVLFGVTYLLCRRATERSIPFRTVVIGAVVLVLFFGVAVYRAPDAPGGGTGVEIVGGQGSNLHIMTNVLAWIDGGLELRHGGTYWQSILRTVLPFRASQAAPLSVWFRDQYAPGALGGYGFGLDAEAYLNWGVVGVIGVFLAFGYCVALVIDLEKTGSIFWRFCYLYGYVVTLYAIRGDSLMVIKALVYGAGAFLGLLLIAGGGSYYMRRVCPKTAA